jgi:hypothetical protein
MPSGLKPSYILLNPKTESSSPDQDKNSANNSKEHQENSKTTSGGKYKLFEIFCNLAVEYQLYFISKSIKKIVKPLQEVITNPLNYFAILQLITRYTSCLVIY